MAGKQNEPKQKLASQTSKPTHAAELGHGPQAVFTLLL